ncbi:4Fe-4S dicluster domain-containing protein [Desulforhopalus singaporensis]|uniref:Fe-S-cluster-containing dehydrogenase component n=1 Tax=Desulforhopalus singaporensis TaxID=91360 RepID=A0A1H0S635_9BACT|nr:4Fe-4S dicluster domain-containing protein [Desulforhopalus singaporensis]SDP36698.1 Fe-S-cluster-containing dehydrogenase component [Desulforhopalus singaporensis]
MKTQTSRRTLLKKGLGSAAAAIFLRAKTARSHNIKRYPNSCGVLVDMTRCIGCRSCEAACNAEQKLPSPALPFDDRSLFAQGRHGSKRRTDENHFTVINRYDPPEIDHPLFRKIQCNHCQEPACLSSCFVNAYTKTPEGAVIYNPDVCVGCRTCMIACPFYIPAFRYSSALHPQIVKCQFCYETRLKNNLLPACVEACPQEALLFGKREKLIKIARHRIRNDRDRYVDHIYGEYEAGGTSWLYLSSVEFDQVGFDTTIPHEPILNSVKNFLAMVPMVLTIWPPLFAGFHLLAARRARAEKTRQENNREKADEDV